MLVLLQNCVTHEFLGPLNQWTEGKANARNFRSSAAAVEYCVHHEMPDCPLVMKFNGSRYDVVIPVSSECRKHNKVSN